MSDYQERIAKALGWPRLKDDTIAEIERAIIQETGNGELAAYIAEWLFNGPHNLAAKIESALRAAVRENSNPEHTIWPEGNCKQCKKALEAGIEELEKP